MKRRRVLKRFKTRRPLEFRPFSTGKENVGNFRRNFFAVFFLLFLLLINDLLLRRNAATQRKKGVFPVWRRDCLIAGVPLTNAAHRVARGYLARSFAKSFRLAAFEGVFLFLDGAFGVEFLLYFVSFS